MQTKTIHYSQDGRVSLLAIVLIMIVSGGLIAAGYWMGQESHRELAGIVSAPVSTTTANAPSTSGENGSLASLTRRQPDNLTGRWRVTDASRDTPLRDVEFYADGRVQLRDEEGGGFIGTYTAENGRLGIRAPEGEGGRELFSGSYSVAGNRLSITHDDVVVMLVSGPEAEKQAADFLMDQRIWKLEDVEKIAIRTDERYGCRAELAEAFRDEDLEVVGERIADAWVLVDIERQPLSTPELPLANTAGWHYFYSATVLGKDDSTLFEFESDVEEETELEACEELAEILAEEVVDAID